jgi:hypothetical protein
MATNCSGNTTTSLSTSCRGGEKKKNKEEVRRRGTSCPILQEMMSDHDRRGGGNPTSISGKTTPFASAMSTPLVTLLLATTRRELSSGERSMTSLLSFTHRHTYL